MKYCAFLRGLQASGKTTWAKAKVAELAQHGISAVHANKDAIRIELGVKGGGKQEKAVVAHERNLVENAMMDGRPVIIDNTHFNPVHEKFYRDLAEHYNYQFDVIDFTHVPLEECIRRDNARANGVGEAVIRQTYDKYLRPGPDVYSPDPFLPPAVICDLDGTLANMGDRSPYDTDKYHLDTANKAVREVLFNLGVGVTILFVSGRCEAGRPGTEEWLHKEMPDMAYSQSRQVELFMRKDGDIRKDAIVKREIFDQHIRDKYRVLFVMDDRDSVVEMWRQLGLTCFQVAPGNF